MTEAEIKALFAELIGDIAPEADMSSLLDDDDMREALDLDSMDFNNLIIALHKRTGIDVPESDLQQAVHIAGRHGLSQQEMNRSLESAVNGGMEGSCFPGDRRGDLREVEFSLLVSEATEKIRLTHVGQFGASWLYRCPQTTCQRVRRNIAPLIFAKNAPS
jgi:acyl carrier protein